MTLEMLLGAAIQFADAAAAAPDVPMPKSTAELKQGITKILPDGHIREMGIAVIRSGEVEWQGGLERWGGVDRAQALPF
jgi:hypothetical protein